MLNFGSKPSQDASLRKIAIWGADLVLCSAPKFGPHPGGSYGGQGGLSFYVGGKGRQWTQISHRKLKNSISHSMAIWVQEPDAMLRYRHLPRMYVAAFYLKENRVLIEKEAIEFWFNIFLSGFRIDLIQGIHLIFSNCIHILQKKSNMDHIKLRFLYVTKLRQKMRKKGRN